MMSSLVNTGPATEKPAPVLVPPRRDEFDPPPDMPKPPIFPPPEFFHSFRGAREISGRLLFRAEILSPPYASFNLQIIPEK
jgi:hypothetical protein